VIFIDKLGESNIWADYISRPSKVLKAISSSSCPATALNSVNVGSSESLLLTAIKSMRNSSTESILSSSDALSLLAESQRSDPVISKLFSKSNYFINGDSILCKMVYRDNNKSLPPRICYVLTPDIGLEICRTVHVQQFHASVKALRFQVSRSFVWQGIDRDCKDTVSGCSYCNEKRKSDVYYRKCDIEPRRIDSAANRCWLHVSIDATGMITGSTYRYVLAFICHFSRFCWLLPLKNLKATSITRAVATVFDLFGTPEIIHSDNGLKSDRLSSFCSLHGVKHITTAPYSPFSNGLVERRMRD
jgi:hypothetical protein